MAERKAIDYDKLKADLCEAAAAARKIRNLKGDGGASNSDGLLLKLPRATRARVYAAGEAASCSVFRVFAGHFSISTPYPNDSQGYENTARATAMVELLKARGWDVSLRSIID